MSARVAINGMGRIGRALCRLVLKEPSLDLVAVNDLMSAENLEYLLRFDSVYGRNDTFTRSGQALTTSRGNVHVLRERNPALLPWKQHEVALVFECTGAFRNRPDIEKHVAAGARMVILSAPTTDDAIETIVHGVNHPGEGAAIVSCASCTTNCIAPVVEVVERRIGIAKAVMTTVHASTASQSVVDAPNTHVRRGRAAAGNLIPTETGAAHATARALPGLAGRFDGLAIRAPLLAGSIADITFVTTRRTTVGEVNAIFIEEAATPRYNGILGVSFDPLVSSDVVGDARASIIDLALTRVIGGDLVKVMSWYDNEWGYANQLVREAVSLTGGGGLLPRRESAPPAGSGTRE
jgi:glyceraldehyde 3-phosphate dehydrogenase